MHWVVLRRGLVALVTLLGVAPACGSRALVLGPPGKGGAGAGAAGGQTASGGAGGGAGTTGSGGTNDTVGVGGAAGVGGTVGVGGAAGTGGTVGVDGGTPPQPCARESDCPSGMVCGYPLHGGCAAQGVCVPRWPPPGAPACGALIRLCGCDATPVFAGCNFAPGYAPAPTPLDLSVCDIDPVTIDGGCPGWGENCGPGASCCAGLACSQSGSTALPGSCVPL